MMMTDEENIQCIEINPPTPPKGTVILLHGLGADGNDLVPIISQLHLPSALQLRFLFPNAPLRPVTINNGYVMPAWYDIVSMQINEHADQKGIAASVKQLNRLIDAEEKKGISSDKIVLAGFSQGAVIALSTGLRSQKKLAGILALSGYLPYADQVLAEKSSINQKMPIFIAHGTQDTVVPIFLGHAAYAALEKQSYPVQWHPYTMGHSICDREILDISQWLQGLFKT